MKIGILGAGMVGQTIGDKLIQQRFPDTRAVKAFNTLTAALKVNPARLSDLVRTCSSS